MTPSLSTYTAFVTLALASVVVTAALVIVSYGREHALRLRGLRTVATAYAVSTLRYFVIIAAPLLGAAAATVAGVLHLLAMALIAIAAARLGGLRDDRRGWILGIALAAALWVSYGTAAGSAVAVLTVPVALLSGAALLFLGWGLFALARSGGYAGYRVSAFIACVHGVQQFAMPVWPTDPYWSFWGPTLGGILYLATAASLLLAVQGAQTAAARRAQRRADLLFDHTSDLMSIVTVERDGTLRWEAINESLRRFFARAYPERALGAMQARRCEDVLGNDLGLPPAEVEAALSGFREAATQRRPLASTIRNADRTREGVITPIVESDGSVRHLYYRATDITDRLQRETDLAHSASNQRTILEQMPVGIAITARSEGHLRFVNSAWVRLTGISRESALGRTATELGLWEGSRAVREEVLRPLLEHGQPVLVPRRFVNPSGEEKAILLRALPFDLGDEPCVLTMIQDVTELESVRAEMGAERARLDTLFNLSPVPFLITSRDGLIREVNAAWAALFGFTVSEVRGRTTQSLDLWTDPTDRERMIAGLRGEGRVRRFEARLRRCDGTPLDVLIASHLIDWRGERCLFSATLDVSELIAARKQAQDESERFVKTFSLSPVPMLVSAAADGRHLEVNEAWVRYSGYAAAEAIGRTALEMGIWVDPKERVQIIEDLRAGRQIRQVPVTQRRRSGEIAHALFSAERLDWRGTPAVIVAIEDVSALEGARREALISSALFERVLAVSPIPMGITSTRSGMHLFVNDAWVALTGVSRERAMITPARDLNHWADPAARQHVIERLQRGESIRNARIGFRHADGHRIEILYSAEHIDWKGEPALIGMGQDVSALDQALEEIGRLNTSLDQRVRERTAELEHAIQEIESFSYSVAHDLRAPLRHISGYMSHVARHPKVQADAALSADAGRAISAAEHLGALVDDLLEYSRASRKALRRSTVALDPLLDSIIDELTAAAPERSVRWEREPLPSVRADRTLLHAALRELLGNALKYTRLRENAVISVRARPGPQDIELCISDNGVGLDMAYASKLFGVFQRLHTDPAFEGTGIGLAYVKRIVERHGGRIRAEGAQDQGARFTITLPTNPPA